MSSMPTRLLALRQPADPAYLARRLAVIDWRPNPPPAPGSRWWLVETCRAELDWAWADWLRLTGGNGEARHPSDAPHPAETLRLAHEQVAARLVSCHLQADVEARQLRLGLQAAKSQRSALRKETQGPAYRASWQAAHARTLADIAALRPRRARTWRAFLAAAAEYRQQRALVDAQQPWPEAA